MLFNSIDFAIFLPLVFLLYWFLAKSRVKAQNILLLLASYFFYACWDYRFLFLLIFSTLLDYVSGIQMQEARSIKHKKLWFWSSILVNIGFLGVFKYYNFFAESFAEALAPLGVTVNPGTLQVILPVGISFYTFHGLSYVIDIYKNRIPPEKNFITYAVFVCFFPLLVAGPIERATHLLPQLRQKRDFSYTKAVDGLRQILWGLFKKLVIADNCAAYANEIFNAPGQYHGSTLVLGAVYFAFQIYADFSGYSDIALGTARLFGIDLLRNFAYPYFSRDIAEFWRRWHISLSTWFRDYLYIPLGGSKGGTWMKMRNTFVIFLVSGFWHGANWTFIFWGFLNALYIMPAVLLKTNRNNLDIVAQDKYFPSLKDALSMLVTFALTCFAWIFFRAENMAHAWEYIAGIFSGSLFTIPETVNIPRILPVNINLLILFFITMEWLGRQDQYAIQHTGTKWLRPLKWSFYIALIVLIFIHQGKEEPFIYFQF